jgi:hypothetical protein
MLQWKTEDTEAIYPFERYRAVSSNREHRIFFRHPDERQVLAWILVVREDDVHIHHGTYRSIEEAKRAAELWEGPPPPKG